MRRHLIPLAALLALSVCLPSAASAALPKKQQFEVTYEATYHQTWIAKGDHFTNADFAEQCVVGLDARGNSNFGARTKKTVVSLPADAKRGVIYGQVPTRAWVRRTFHIGEKPPEGCGYDDYDELSQLQDCNNAPQWDRYEGWDNPDAYLNIIAGKGVVKTDVHREREKEHLAALLPYCPFLGSGEGDVDHTGKLPTKKLFSGKPVTIKGETERSMNNRATHPTSGASKYELTIRYLGKRR